MNGIMIIDVKADLEMNCMHIYFTGMELTEGKKNVLQGDVLVKRKLF